MDELMKDEDSVALLTDEGDEESKKSKRKKRKKNDSDEKHGARRPAYGIAWKTIAFIALVFCVAFAAISLGSVFILVENEGYTQELTSIKEDLLHSVCYEYAEQAFQENLVSTYYYSMEPTNLRFEIEDRFGKVLYNNLEGEENIGVTGKKNQNSYNNSLTQNSFLMAQNQKADYDIVDAEEWMLEVDESTAQEAGVQITEDVEAVGEEDSLLITDITESTDTVTMAATVETPKSGIQALREEKYEFSYMYLFYWDGRGYSEDGRTEYLSDAAGEILVKCYVPRELTVMDKVKMYSDVLSVLYRFRYHCIVFFVCSTICGLLLFVYLLCAAGRSNDRDGVVENPFDRIPFDVYTVGILLIFYGFAIFFSMVVNRGNDAEVVFFTALLAVTAIPMVIGYLLSVATRMKKRRLFHNTLIWMCIALVWKAVRLVFTGLFHLIAGIPLIWKLFLLTGMISFAEFAVLLMGPRRYIMFLVWLCEKAVLVPILFYYALQFKKIQKGTERIASGDTAYRIDNRYLIGEMKKHSDCLNTIGNGINEAVDERMKSERFKTELITNVSHDIKTPLTSIINYVDLLQKEDLPGENARQYTEVLARQSGRLKRLIEDLVEASKAATGNIEMNFMQLNVSVMLLQTIGEFEDKAKKGDIEIVPVIPEPPVYIMADGRRLWRVFDNLMNNICKYSLPGTRAYLSLVCNQNQVEIIFKNVSKTALNLSEEELTERFVRGDSSRNTEGNGLGLAIAKSLVELQHGTLRLVTDGDLFKAILHFPIIQNVEVNDSQNK